MKYSIDKTEFETFSDDLKKEYTEKDGVFTLNIEGHEDFLVPKAKKDLAEQHRKEAEKKVTEAEARESKLMKDLEESGKSAKDVESIRAQYQKDIEQVKADYAEKEKVALQDQAKLLIDSEASKFAGEKFTIPSLVARAYKDRLAVESVDGHQVIRVRELDGKPSVKSLSDLQKEFLDNPEFSSIVKTSSGSGGGASSQSGPGGSAQGKTMSRSQFDTLTAEARLAVMTDGSTVLADD